MGFSSVERVLCISSMRGVALLSSLPYSVNCAGKAPYNDSVKRHGVGAYKVNYSHDEHHLTNY